MNCEFNCGNPAVWLGTNHRMCEDCANEQTHPTVTAAHRYGLRTFGSASDYTVERVGNGRWLTVGGTQPALPQQGAKVVVTQGEFRSKVLAVGHVYADRVELQALNPVTGRWEDFCTATLAELTTLTRPL